MVLSLRTGREAKQVVEAYSAKRLKRGEMACPDHGCANCRRTRCWQRNSSSTLTFLHRLQRSEPQLTLDLIGFRELLPTCFDERNGTASRKLPGDGHFACRPLINISAFAGRALRITRSGTAGLMQQGLKKRFIETPAR